MSIETDDNDANETSPRDPADVAGEAEDQALMRRIAVGDSDAFSRLADKYQHPLMTFCYSFLREYTSAEDMTQETFLRVFRNAKRYEPTAKFTTWLYRIAANLCINELKKRKLRMHASLDAQPIGLDADGTKLVNRIASSTEIPLTKIERQELGGILKKAIDALPDDQRRTLILVEYMHMPYKEIADILDVTLSAIKMRVKRARDSLRVALQFLDSEK